MNKFFLFFTLIILYTHHLDAQEAQLEDFESLLENMSDIATKKSLNVDYLPSVVTVVDAQTFVDAGVVNVGEALGMLPGFQMQLSPTGFTMTTVRGLKNPNAYLSDKIKILVDGVVINNEIAGSSNVYLDFPMQLVEKIEVLRGPSSTVYGSGAFYGVVNIITKLGNATQENQLYAKAGSYNYLSAGTNLYTISKKWKIFADGYYQKNSRDVGIDKELSGLSNEASTDINMKDFSLGFRAINGGFEFLTRYKRNISTNLYSLEGNFEPIPSSPKEHDNSYFLSQLSYNILMGGYNLKLKANLSHKELDEGVNLAPIGALGLLEGFFYKLKQKEQNFEAETILTLPQVKSNNILVGIGMRYVRVVGDEYYNSLEELYYPTREKTLFPENLDRTIVYAYAEDLLSLSRKVDVTLGLRVDNYSDFGTQLSKRIGVVYRATDKTIFKLLYGSAFRAPTFTEAYATPHVEYRGGDKNLKPEETNTYEAVAIYSPNFNNKFSLNLFYSDVNNIIDLEEDDSTPQGYRNYEARASKGVEFEYSYHLQQEHSLYLNATYVDTEYKIPPDNDFVDYTQSMPDISKVMLKGMYIYRPITRLSFGTTWQYYAETTKSILGTQSWVKSKDTSVHAQNIFDETITYRFSASSELSVSLKNIFDEDVRQPSYYYNTPGGITREGRNFLASYVQKF